MKKFIFIATLALMAACAAPSYGQMPVLEAPVMVGVESPCTPAAQMDVMCSPVTKEYLIAPCSFISQDILDTVGAVAHAYGPVVRLPMLKPEDIPVPTPLYGMRLCRPPVKNESALSLRFAPWNYHAAPPHCIRNAVFLPGTGQASGNPVILEL